MFPYPSAAARLRAAVFLACAALAGCAGLPRERGYAETAALVGERRPVADGAWWASTRPAPPTTALDAQAAVDFALLNSPRMRETWSELGLARAELESARRLPNPRFGYSRRRDEDGGHEISRGVALPIAELLMLGPRRRVAGAELERTQQQVAASVIAFASEVEIAWYAAVAAQQVARMRELVAQAAEASAALAQRFFDAGNIDRLQLAQEQASLSDARIDALRAGSDALRARRDLGALLGLSSQLDWTTLEQMPAPVAVTLDADAMVTLALQQRLDLGAAQRRVATLEDMLGVTRRWRWIGDVELGYERESETGGGLLRGPSIELELPIFDQGQGALARAEAELAGARAQLDAQALSVRDEAALALDRLRVSHQIAERYRSALLPQREAIVARTQERVNYMLTGVFELIQSRQQEFDAYQGYLEAVRDYWTARAELRAAVGGRLPDDGAALAPTIGVDAILPSAKAADPHAGHDMSAAASKDDPHAGHDMSGASSKDDPHAGHDMSGASSKDDPHAGHDMSGAASKDDPHAGHDMPGAAGKHDPDAGHDRSGAANEDDPHAGHDMSGVAGENYPHAGHDMSDTAGGDDPHAGHRMPAAAADEDGLPDADEKARSTPTGHDAAHEHAKHESGEEE